MIDYIVEMAEVTDEATSPDGLRKAVEEEAKSAGESPKPGAKKAATKKSEKASGATAGEGEGPEAEEGGATS